MTLSETESDIPEEAKNFVAPDENSERVDDPAKAEAMARATLDLGKGQVSVDELRTGAAGIRADLRRNEQNRAFWQKQHDRIIPKTEQDFKDKRLIQRDNDRSWGQDVLSRGVAEDKDSLASEIEDLAAKKYDRSHPESEKRAA